jgi:hypothetical protein
MLVFGFLNQPEASYTDLQQMMEFQEIHVSPQAIEERMTPQAAALMSRLLEEMVAMIVSGQESHFPVLQSFNGVYLQDGTIVTLPDELQEHWRGSGERGGEAGLRVQLRIGLRAMGNLQVPGCKMLALAKIPERRRSNRPHCPREHSTSPIVGI